MKTKELLKQVLVDYIGFFYKGVMTERELRNALLIFEALLDMNENDILIYSDAGVEFINNVSHIIDKMDEDLFLFGNNYNHVDWCKMDVIKTINSNNYYLTLLNEDHLKQIQASVIFIRPTQKAKEFIKEWLLYCQMPNLIDDSPSKVS